MNRAVLLPHAVSVLLLLAGCTDSPPAMPSGEAVYRLPLADGNVFSCATCHALSEPSSDGLRRPGHPIGNATRRATYKGGAVSDLRVAVNTCITDWMNGEAFALDDPRWIALSDFLETQATVEVDPPIALQIVNPQADLSGGDIEVGREVFNGSCAVCHGRNAVGTGLAPQLTGGRELTVDYIAERVRKSGSQRSSVYSGLSGGIMPFWSEDRLSDAELLDLVAFVNMVSQEVAPPDPGMVDAGSVDPDAGGPTGCATSHARVGQVAEFITRFHEVGGSAHIIDDCTIELRDFTFDGTGVDVRLYGGLGGNYEDGVSIGNDLRRSGGYNGDTLRFSLPVGVTLDDLDGVSVWCVPVGVSFGDGVFAAP